MQYRLDKKGNSVSILGFGCMRFPRKGGNIDMDDVEFIGYLEIKKLSLKQGLVSKNSYYNNVNLNIQILKESDYPDKELGNVILASHSGTSGVSYFKNLYKLSVGDEAKIYYKGNIYSYNIDKIYDVPKVGKITINRDISKTCLTLITCTKNNKKSQTVYILELTSIIKDGV